MEDFRKEFKIDPGDWVEVKKVAGCPTDGVPGVSGVGIKRAIKYIKGELTGKKYQNIIYNKKLIKRNEKLVKLPFEGTKEFPLVFNPLDLNTIFEVCEQFGLYSLLQGKRLDTWKTFVDVKE